MGEQVKQDSADILKVILRKCIMKLPSQPWRIRSFSKP